MSHDQFPGYRLVTLIMRQISSPIASRITRYAKTHPKFSQVVCVRACEVYRRAEWRARIVALRAAGHRDAWAQRHPPPIPTTQAQEMGADILSEVVLFMLGAMIVTFEFHRQAVLKEAKLQDERDVWQSLLSLLKEIEEELKDQQKRIDLLRVELAELQAGEVPVYAGDWSTGEGYWSTTKDHGSTGEGQRSIDEGQRITDKGHESTDKSHASTDKISGSKDEGHRSIANGHKSTDKGYGSREEGHGSTAESHRSTDESYGIDSLLPALTKALDCILVWLHPSLSLFKPPASEVPTQNKRDKDHESPDESYRSTDKDHDSPDESHGSTDKGDGTDSLLPAITKALECILLWVHPSLSLPKPPPSEVETPKEDTREKPHDDQQCSPECCKDK